MSRRPYTRPNHLTEPQWLEAMRACAAGATDTEVAAKWGVSRSTVSKQRRRRGVPRGVPRERAGEVDGVDCAVMKAVDDLLIRSAVVGEGENFRGAGEAARAAAAQLNALAARRRVLNRPEPDAAPPDPAARPALRPAQRAPSGPWRTWLFLGGRGAGKTLAGAAWLAGQARVYRRLALVGPTLLDVREVMIEGPSGLRGAAAGFGPEGGRPTYEPSRRRLRWPNGAQARVFSAEDPDSLRGPQFEAAWADEFCAWAKPGDTLAMLRLGLRLGEAPRLVVTTTPKPSRVLRGLMEEATLEVTRGSARENAAHLAPGWLDDLRGLYGGTRLERQEIEGEVLEAPEGAVFRRADVDRARARGLEPRPARFERLIVAVDPPAGVAGAACGVVTVGRVGREAWVLEDATVRGLTPAGWSARVALAAERAAALGPVSVTAEANQGGEMVRQVLKEAGLDTAALRLVHAKLDKRARAEPVALLYEQGRVAHAPGLEALEDQMTLLGAPGCDAPGESPDRADALVWGLTELMFDEAGTPRVRRL